LLKLHREDYLKRGLYVGLIHIHLQNMKMHHEKL